jgi:hypothetical protein
MTWCKSRRQQPRRSTTGAFSWSRRSDDENFAITGQFAADASQVEGRLSFVTQFDARPCEARDVPFRARLTGRPARTHPGRATECASMPGRGRGSGVGVRERGIGCTKAKALELAWAHDSACRKSPSAPKCRVEGFECSGVHGGRFSPPAAVRCVTAVPPTGAVEFVMKSDCGYVRSARLNLTAANIPCRRARRIARRMPKGCGDDRVGQRCKSGRYRCRVTALSTDSTLGRCVRRDDPFFTVWFEYVWPL